MKGLLATCTLALVVAAASVSGSRDARATRSAEEAQTSPGSANPEERDASDSNADEAERVRLRAEYARLKARHDELEARLASLEAEAAKKSRQSPASKLGPWEGLGLYAISFALAVLWSWRWKGERR